VYSINNGFTYQTSSIFNNLCPGTYTIITNDAINSRNSQTITVGFDGQPITYQLSLSANTNAAQTVTTNNYSSKTTYLEAVVTPPLPVGITVSFNLNLSSVKIYNGPGVGVINDNTIITQGGIIKTPSTPSLISQTGDRPDCNPESQLVVNEADTYTLSITNNSKVLITNTSVLQITDGEAGDQSNCLTNLNQTIYTQFTIPSIQGDNCCSVIADDRLVIINENSVTYVPNSEPTPITWTEYFIYGFDPGQNRGVACGNNDLPPQSPQTVYATTNTPELITQFYNSESTSNPYINSIIVEMGIPGNVVVISFTTRTNTSIRYSAYLDAGTGAIGAGSVIPC
jgi:hypothetical protein